MGVFDFLTGKKPDPAEARREEYNRNFDAPGTPPGWKDIRDALYNTVATEGSPIEAFLQKLSPDYRSTNTAGIYAKDPDTQGMAMGFAAPIMFHPTPKGVVRIQTYPEGGGHIYSHPGGEGHLYVEATRGPINEYESKVGGAGFLPLGDEALKVGTAKVNADWRRLGIASAMYDLAELASGRRVMPSEFQSADAKALWKARTARDKNVANWLKSTAGESQ